VKILFLAHDWGDNDPTSGAIWGRMSKKVKKRYREHYGSVFQPFLLQWNPLERLDCLRDLTRWQWCVLFKIDRNFTCIFL